MQDPFLFNASIIENIRFGRPDATFADVVRAARAANAHEFIVEKEDGYDTLIGEGGAQLSGGERQRLSIARAILDDPPILILDEATSAVDSETERAIQEAIAVLIRGRTTIAIAHRLATLRNAHRLLVLEDGKVAEQGTHEELLAREDGVFARLVRLQTENNRLRTETFAL
jgi:ABC-type multidrug transport system fused ATPase/permease subunit